MKLEIKQLNAEEVRRGWVRIHENSRMGIPAGSLLKITRNGKFVRRIVLGATNKSPVSEGCIAMDEPTREKLDIKDKDIGKELIFDIIKYGRLRGKFASVLYYWNHPDFPLRFSTRMAITLGSLSIIISVIGIIW